MSVKLAIVELHSHETIIPFKLTTFFRFVLFPSCKSKIDIFKCTASKCSYRIRHFNNALIFQLHYELIGKFFRRRAYTSVKLRI